MEAVQIAERGLAHVHALPAATHPDVVAVGGLRVGKALNRGGTLRRDLHPSAPAACSAALQRLTVTRGICDMGI